MDSFVIMSSIASIILSGGDIPSPPCYNGGGHNPPCFIINDVCVSKVDGNKFGFTIVCHTN